MKPAVLDFEDDDHAEDDCFQCGGEGFVFDCIDGQCLDCDVGCDICTKRCDVCNPLGKPAP